MAILLNKIWRRLIGKKDTLVYPNVKIIGHKKEKDLVERMCRDTTLNENEARMALSQVKQALLDFLMDGYSVEFTDWASFRPTVSAEGSPTEKECTAAKVKRVNCRCTFSSEFMARLQKSTFVFAGDLHTTDPK